MTNSRAAGQRGLQQLLHKLAAQFQMILFFSPRKCTFSPPSLFYPLFLTEDGRIRGKRLSKLPYRFRRYSSLTKTVLLNICKVMTIFFKFWPEKIRKTVITLQILRFQRISLKSRMQLTKTFFPNSAIFSEKKWVEN